tara:strand:+ start:719 stop:1087 length:369 start_codon:yes stop_codon:yes gene_type:complete
MFQVKPTFIDYLGHTSIYRGKIETLHENIQTVCKDLGYGLERETGSYTIQTVKVQLKCDIYKNEDNTFTLDVRRFYTPKHQRELYIPVYNIFMYHLHAKGELDEVRYLRNMHVLPSLHNNNL